MVTDTWGFVGNCNSKSQFFFAANKVFPVHAMDKSIFIVLFWSLCILVHLEGLPISKRSISEVQLMHNVGEHKQAVERQDWLQVKLKTVIIPSINDSQKGQKGKTRTLYSDFQAWGSPVLISS
ncbi:parathyroid hormone 1b [Tachysurus fulvidraco]|uniref:parathyroid hormone 1b n=1 Tax=Tachysurus fulvidraco TaxID=1234273 RepID=UPI000F4F89FF|nr:parathyroid hormone 1b [Tachysurus fulvidraco]